jgi:hypothetical protein
MDCHAPDPVAWSAGTARVTDPTTIITNFFYDGGRLGNVRVYFGIRGDYRGGFAFGPQLAGMPKSAATFSATLPAGKSLAELDGVSRCTSRGVTVSTLWTSSFAADAPARGGRVRARDRIHQV